MTAQFNLKGLLRLRGIQQDQAAGVLAAANRDLNAVKDRRTSTAEHLAGSGSTPDTLEALMAIASARASTRSMFLELDGVVAASTARAEVARQGFSKAKSDTAALEKLADRHRTQAAAEELRVEQNALDEISTGPRAPVAGKRA